MSYSGGSNRHPVAAVAVRVTNVCVHVCVLRERLYGTEQKPAGAFVTRAPPHVRAACIVLLEILIARLKTPLRPASHSVAPYVYKYRERPPLIKG